MKPPLESEFIQFLEQELDVSPASIRLALKHYTGDYRLLPIVLWQFGLATLDEVSDMFDWLHGQSGQPVRS